MKAPSILPAVAHRAGISEALALKLWRRASSETEWRLGVSDGPEYHRMATEAFLSLADDESSNQGCQLSPRFTWVWRQQHRLSFLSMLAFERTWQDWNTCWQDCLKEAT